MVRQEVVKAVKVSGGAGFWRCGWSWFAGPTNQQVDSFSTCLEAKGCSLDSNLE